MVSVSDVYLFLVRVLQINYLLRGFNHSRQWTQCREGASTIISEDLYILQSTYVQGLANRRIISINSTYRVCHNWNRNPEGEHFYIKSLPDHEGVLEYFFSCIDIYLFY